MVAAPVLAPVTQVCAAPQGKTAPGASRCGVPPWGLLCPRGSCHCAGHKRKQTRAARSKGAALGCWGWQQEPTEPGGETRPQNPLVEGLPHESHVSQLRTSAESGALQIVQQAHVLRQLSGSRVKHLSIYRFSLFFPDLFTAFLNAYLTRRAALSAPSLPRSAGSS